jgi:uncharacterized OB-fold protein
MAGRCEECGIEAEYVHLWNRGPNSGSSLCIICAHEREKTFWLIRSAFADGYDCEKCGERHEPFQIDCGREEFLERKRKMDEFFNKDDGRADSKSD